MRTDEDVDPTTDAKLRQVRLATSGDNRHPGNVTCTLTGDSTYISFFIHLYRSPARGRLQWGCLITSTSLSQMRSTEKTHLPHFNLELDRGGGATGFRSFVCQRLRAYRLC